MSRGSEFLRRPIVCLAAFAIVVIWGIPNALAQESEGSVESRIVDEFWNAQNPDALDGLVTDDYARHGPSHGQVADAAAVKEWAAMIWAAFPDFHIEVVRSVRQDDWVFMAWRVTGTHQGELMGIMPTNASVTIVGMSSSRMVGDRVAEEWVVWNEADLLRQLGVLPPAGTAVPPPTPTE